MPTSIVHSAIPDYKAITAQGRLDIVLEIRREISEVLEIDEQDIEGWWSAPFDPESAVNTLPFSVHIEFSMLVSQDTLEELAGFVLDVFDRFAEIPTGVISGVWIKTPYAYYWAQRLKK